MKAYTPYQERIRESFSTAYRFFDKYQCPRTDGDWTEIIESLSQYKDPFMVDLIVAVVDEFKREYEESGRGDI